MDTRAALSAKEAEALELVAAQYTTKEIARELRITPRAVEERLRTARDKLGASDRRTAARIYQSQREDCGDTTGHPTTVANPYLYEPKELRDLPTSSVFSLQDSSFARLEDEGVGLTVLEAFDIRFGKAGRFGAIVLLAVALAMLGAAAVSIAVTLGQLA